jgi:prolyl-tRNA synthetase
LVVADIRNAAEGDPSPQGDGGVLHVRKGIEIGHVFKLGDRYTKAMNITVLNVKNERQHPIMGCYGIGINRILAAAIEHEAGHDADGIIWPAAIAPYAVLITVLKYEGPAKAAADKLAAELEAGGLDVLIDDRDERPGVKFKDADLIGIPVRLTIGEKGLASAQAEVKSRKPGSQVELVGLDSVAAHVRAMLATQ